MKDILVFAIHPDDETLGCGGTLLRHKASGDRIHWLIATKISEKLGYASDKVTKRKKEISDVANLYQFDSIHFLDLNTTQCDQYPTGEIINKISNIIQNIKPHILYLPFKHDVHSDHRVCFDAIYACTKSFRYPFIEKILMMETLSETDFTCATPDCTFTPNIFIDISNYIDKKCEAMQIYESEISPHPFPRSIETIKSLAKIRGAAANVNAAESFMLLKEIQK